MFANIKKAPHENRMLVVKVGTLLIFLYTGLRALQSFLTYSLALNGAKSISDTLGAATALNRRNLALICFLLVQVAGGVTLGSLTDSGGPWQRHLRRLPLLIGCFMLTGFGVVFVILWGR